MRCIFARAGEEMECGGGVECTGNVDTCGQYQPHVTDHVTDKEIICNQGYTARNRNKTVYRITEGVKI